jgi:uncharacterized membrane protein
VFAVVPNSIPEPEECEEQSAEFIWREEGTVTQTTDAGHTSNPQRRRRGFLAMWNMHPAVPTGDQLTLGEKAADRMRNGLGSWIFVAVFIAVMISWAIANSVLRLAGTNGKHGFDPYPYILLNLFLSMLAGLQGAILLIAAKRSDQIASQLAEHDFETDTKAAERIETLHQRLADMASANRSLLEQNNEILQRLAAAQSGPAP